MTMLANELTPFCPTHPGEILKDEVEYRKISQRALARQMGISYSQLNEVLNGKRPVNTELALLFEAALGLDPEMLLNMQTRYNMQVARADQRTQDRWNEVRKLCASFLSCTQLYLLSEDLFHIQHQPFQVFSFGVVNTYRMVSRLRQLVQNTHTAT